MIELANYAGWPAALVPGWGPDRERQYTLVVKRAYRFSLDGSVQALGEARPLVMADEYYGEPGASSLAAASEMVPFKTGAELLIRGTAYPPAPGARTMLVEAGLSLADGSSWKKALRVTGQRYWKRGLLGAMPSEPKPLEPLPLRYEYAFGGHDARRDVCEERNPVGLGFAYRGRVAHGQPLPQIEQGPAYILRGGHRPQPAGFGPIPAYWAPRVRDQDGVAEAAIEAGQCPYPNPVPSAFFNAAPADQRFDKPFLGGETISLRGFFPEPEARAGVSFTLPTVKPEAFLVLGQTWQPLRLVCDTLSIDTDAREVHLIWRGGVPWKEIDPRKAWVVLHERSSQLELEVCA